MSSDISGTALEVEGEQVQSDLAWCHEVVQDVSRTFAITIEVLEEPMSTYICTGYLLCRVADTLEDAAHIPPTTTASLLRRYDQVLDPGSDYEVEHFLNIVESQIPERDESRAADWDVVAECDRVFRVFHGLPTDVQAAIRPPVREMVDGMVMFVERYAGRGGLRIQTVDELEEYCYYVAGTVGVLITNLVATDGISDETHDQLLDLAESFALVLQLVNISKDVHDDFTEENNVYLPETWLRDEDIAPDEVVEEENADDTGTVIRQTVNRARSYLDDAQQYLVMMPEHRGNRVEAWAVPFFLAVGTMREVADDPEAVVREGGAKLSRSEVYEILETASSDLSPERIEMIRSSVASGSYQ